MVVVFWFRGIQLPPGLHDAPLRSTSGDHGRHVLRNGTPDAVWSLLTRELGCSNIGGNYEEETRR